MTDFWLISVPLDKTNSQCLEKLKSTIAKTNLASSFKFPIPELKLGTLDTLLGVSDDLSKLDIQAQSVMRKISQCMAEVMEQSSNKVLENTLTNGAHKNHQRLTQSPLKACFQALLVDLISYITNFQWDKAKYPSALPLKSLADIISKQVFQVETELKSASLQGLERKTNRSLQTRALADIVRREDMVDSEYLTTLLVVVSRGSYGQWESTYESLAEFVVPRSSRRIYEQGEGGIFTVTLFRKAVGEFKANAKQSKFTVREISFDQVEQQKGEMCCLNVDKEHYGTFVRWLKVNFSDVFVAWIHLKALGVFVESVLRYGLPVSFQVVLLQPDRKHVKKLRKRLSSLFAHLEPTATTSKSDIGLDIHGMSVGPQEYYSYICFQFSINLVDPS